ncbi:MAG: hypothetical protein WC516_09250 [Patescibacteria group bacterium]|jgi:hypothetical protein
MERATKKVEKKETVKKVEKEKIVPVLDEDKLKEVIEKSTEKETVVSKPVKVVEVITETGVEREILLKNTGGSFHMGRRRIIKPGEKFKARWSDIPVSFRDTIYPLEDVPIKVSAAPILGKKAEFDLVSRGDGFDVINNESGKKINGIPISEESAKKLIEDLSR